MLCITFLKCNVAVFMLLLINEINGKLDYYRSFQILWISINRPERLIHNLSTSAVKAFELIAFPPHPLPIPVNIHLSMVTRTLSPTSITTLLNGTQTHKLTLLKKIGSSYRFLGDIGNGRQTPAAAVHRPRNLVELPVNFQTYKSPNLGQVSRERSDNENPESTVPAQFRT